VQLGFTIDIAERATCLTVSHAVFDVDVHTLHVSHVQHHGAIGYGEPRNVVPAASDAHLQTTLAAEINACLHVSGSDAAHHEPRSTVDHAVPNSARRVIAGIAIDHDRSARRGAQCVQVSLLERDFALV